MIKEVTQGGPDPVDVHVGRQLRERRALHGISQQGLAEKLGVSFQQVQKYENGRNKIGASRLYELSEILDVSIGYFFEGLGRRPPKITTSRQAYAMYEDPSFFERTSALDQKPEIDRRETLELVRAFNKIGDPLLRRRFFELAKALSGMPTRD